MGRRSRTKSDLPHASTTDAAPRVAPPAGNHTLLIAAGLVILTLLVFGQVGSHTFLNYDDNEYVTQNPFVSRGVTAEGLSWSFRLENVNWHPVTWISHMLDVQLFGMSAPAHALVNVAFHVANTLLLFFLLRRLTAATWRSGIVAALFAIHPLHVESVAWISERKDVLSTLFFLLTIFFYVSFVKSRSRGAYALVLLWFVLGLMAKQMLVTLPFVLLLLDVWPLNRIDLRRPATWKLPLLEKIPLFIVLVPAIWIAVKAQRAMGAIETLDAVPLSLRVSNVITTYVKYLWEMVWPLELIIPYRFPTSIPVAATAGAALLLVAITAAVLLSRRGYLIVGWLWYVGTLVPVIGIVQIGSQAMADRYTYIPLIGIFIALCWLAGEFVGRRPHLATAAGAAAVLLVLALSALAFRQVGFWRDSITLFEHTLAIDPENAIARTNYADALLDAGRVDEAARNFALVKPGTAYERAQIGLGKALLASGRNEDAAVAYRNAATKSPNDPAIRHSLGVVLSRLGRTEEARKEFEATLKIDPSHYEAHLDLGSLLTRIDRPAEASEHFRAAAKTRPDATEPLIYDAIVLAGTGRYREAIDAVDRALLVNPAAANRFLTETMRLPASDANLTNYRAYLAEQTKAAATPATQ